MTPMIDMTFQLIAFFMLLLNFTEGDQNERVKLPDSSLAKPPEGPIEGAIFLNLTKEGTVIYGGNFISTFEALRPYLNVEAQMREYQKKSAADATIIIRADREAPTGRVQELMAVCQQSKFEKFALRAREEQRH